MPRGGPGLILARPVQRALHAVLLAVVFSAGLTAVADGDIFWHLAAGRHMVGTGRLLRADPFSMSALGRPWIDVHWLFQLAAHGVHGAGGLLGLVLVKSALLAAGALLLARVVVHDGQRRLLPFVVVLGGSLVLARHLLPVRPGILTLVFLAAFFLVLERHRSGARPRALLALVAMQVVWVNVQGLSAIGPALVAAYLTGALASAALGARRWFPFAPETGAWRPLALALAGCVAASFVSPYGLDGALLPFRLLLRITPGASVFASQVAENIPPFVLERTAPEYMGHFKWYLGLLALSFALARAHLPLSRLLVVAGLVALALMANRNVVLLYWLATPVLVMNVGPALSQLSDRLHTALSALWGLLLAGVVALAVVTVAREPSLRAPTPFRFPTESARLLAQRPGGGTIFSADHQGGYLIWTLHPRHRPYLDTRLILRTADEYAEFLGLLDHPERFDAFAARHRFDHVVLPTGYPDRYLGLAAHLYRSPGWTLVHTDGAEALFARETGEPAVALGTRATTDALLAGLDARYSGALRAAARLHLARLLLVLGHADQARAVVAPMPDRAARALLARCYLVSGDAATAETLARSLLSDDDDDPHSLALLATISLSRGDTRAGLEWLRRALRADPYHPEARAMLERLEGKGQENQ